MSNMEDDLRKYKLQLQQVEAALTTDEVNEELLKLKSDLLEVIGLTQDLLKKQLDESALSNKEPGNPTDVSTSLFSETDPITRLPKRKKWKSGDRCLAKWEEDGQYYEAIIEDVVDGAARVAFTKYNQLEVCHFNELKDLPAALKRAAENAEDGSYKHPKIHNREYLKKKKQKKQQRFKQIEEERETEKNKWLSFSAKSSKKSGVKGKSIFASPDNVNGRVGIGTCGISGKPMTEFSHGEMWRKGA